MTDDTSKNNKEQDIGFFNKKKPAETKKKTNDMGYKEIPEPREKYKPDKESIHSTPQTPVSSKTDSDARKTMRVPEEQFFEFMALLDISEYAYTYEFLGELIDIKLNSLDSGELREYQNALASIKKKEEKKKNRKK
ncbi:hypothetical protein ACOJIU_18305 (plasmid) [Carnobacterium maltaromaticum]|uniref:hypothetical protein n=1 Tax=Carnobacterium maltaromaticum TaxID=2751 RepID=UPI00344C7132